MTPRLSTKPFDEAAYLDTEAGVAAFLADAFESGDDEVFQEALQIAARARGMTEVARSAGLGRESLYKALQADAQPRFATVRKVMTALGVKLAVVTVKQAATVRRTPSNKTRTPVARKPVPKARSAGK
jgi:probable addiction module antidote protein